MQNDCIEKSLLDFRLIIGFFYLDRNDNLNASAMFSANN